MLTFNKWYTTISHNLLDGQKQLLYRSHSVNTYVTLVPHTLYIQRYVSLVPHTLNIQLYVSLVPHTLYIQLYVSLVPHTHCISNFMLV